MTLKLYFDFMSQPSRALYILLHQCKIPFQQCLVSLRKGEHLTDEYKNDISRFQKVPVIDDDGFKLTESIAILRYVAREKGVPENWYPRESKNQARIDEFLEWQHNNLRLFCAMYFQFKYILGEEITSKIRTEEYILRQFGHEFMIPQNAGVEIEEGIVTLFESKMIETLDGMETLWLQDKAFINGDEISAADVWAACEIEQPRLAGYEPRDGRPVLSAWLDRVKNATSPYYEEAHAILNKIVDRRKTKAKL